MKCYWCIKEFRNKQRKILNVKEAITIYDGKGLCAKHLKAVELATQEERFEERFADFVKTQIRQQERALAQQLEPYGGVYGQLGYHHLMFGR